MYTLYGINSCSTVKKAKGWLIEHEIEFKMHDYRSQGLDIELLNILEAKVGGWDKLFNRRSISWKKLTDEQRENISKESALAYMLETPTFIKRPVLVKDDVAIVGFTPDSYEKQL